MQINPNALRMAKTPCAVGLINTALFLKKRQGPVLEQGHLLGYMIIVGGGGGSGGGGGAKGVLAPSPPNCPQLRCHQLVLVCPDLKLQISPGSSVG